MFRTLLLATVVGAGVGHASNVPAAAALDARSNSPPSYFCSSNTKKCSKQKDSVVAYCSSYLSIPKVTKTQTKTICSTKTSTVTSITGTITGPPKIVTSTITSCAAPAVTITPVEEEDASGDVSDNEEESLPTVESSEPAKRGAPPPPAVYKPSCLGFHKDRSAISAACKCYPIKQSTKIVTKTVTAKPKTTTRIVRTATTLPGPTSTTYIFPTPTFLIANDRGNYIEEECLLSNDVKEIRSGTGQLSFVDDQAANALLFALNVDQSLAALEGSGGDAFELVTPEGEDPDYSVRIGSQGTDLTTTALLSCSISQASDGTCPLDCTVSSDGEDVNQGSGTGDWFLGPPNTVSDSTTTYKTFAVSRSDASQVGGRCRGGRGGFQRARR